MVILLDLDGVIRNSLEYMAAIYRMDFRKQHQKYDADLLVPLGDEGRWYESACNELRDYYHRYSAYDIMRNSRPYDGATFLVNELSKHYEIDIATSQDTMDKKLGTLEWLKYYEIPHRNVFFADEKQLLPGDILIDDTIKNLEKFSDTGRRAIAIARPWNIFWGGERYDNFEDMWKELNKFGGSRLE